MFALTEKITRKKLKSFIERNANNKYTLDIGCANSPYSSFFPNRVGLDVTKGENVDIVADAHELPFPDRTFEQILCTEVLEHLHSPEQAIKEMDRVLKPNGILLLTTRFIFPIHDAPNDYYRYTKYGLRHLFRGWDVLSIEDEVDTIETVAVLLQRIGFQTTLRLNKFSKAVIFLLAKVVKRLSWLITSEYGDIKKQEKESHIMTSGYYVMARKM